MIKPKQERDSILVTFRDEVVIMRLISGGRTFKELQRDVLDFAKDYELDFEKVEIDGESTNSISLVHSYFKAR